MGALAFVYKIDDLVHYVLWIYIYIYVKDDFGMLSTWISRFAMFVNIYIKDDFGMFSTWISRYAMFCEYIYIYI